MAAEPVPAVSDEALLADWADQDGLHAGDPAAAIRKSIDALGDAGKDLAVRHEELLKACAPASDPRWTALYREACLRRRAALLAPHLEKIRRVVFTKHYDMGGSHYAYTEGQSDAQAERHFVPGSSLCVLEMDGSVGKVRTLIDDRGGVLRDPDVSYDGRRILFAWKKSDRQDDYHLYEIDPATGSVRQLTTGLGYADYEGAYLPSGEIVFNSTRCVQTVDCFWTEVSNLYMCDRDGRYLRRVSVDQVHTNYPAVTPDGRVLYTRWDYNDRGQIYPQGLFQMNADGTGQTEMYGNNSWFPTTILHARAVPGTEKVVCILTGHHTRQKGHLALVDPTKGRQEAAGVQLVAPVRETKGVRIDRYGQDGDQFQYPYPLSETAYLASFRSGGDEPKPPRRFGLVLVTADGRRELLAADPGVSCNQPVPLAARPLPEPRPNTVDYRQKEGTYYVQDVYEGPGLAGVPRGTVKRLRVVALEFRVAGLGMNNSGGPGGGALISTPVAVGNGTWDVKVVLGEATVYPDGSAYFAAPARTPVYFQALDEKGYVVQTMRSWSTLQPSERASCVGCHESKNTAPIQTAAATQALVAGAERLAGFYGPPRGFSFAKEIQPILDRHCIRCHTLPPAADGELAKPGEPRPDGTRPVFSLLGREVLDSQAKRKWSESYLALTHARRSGARKEEAFRGKEDHPAVNWPGSQSVPTMLPPYFAGAAKSRLMKSIEAEKNGVKLSDEERRKIACWIDLYVPFCGDYAESNAWTEKEMAFYQKFVEKRRRAEAEDAKSIAEYLQAGER